MENKVGSNFIKSSNLIFLTGGTVIMFYLISRMFFKNEATPLSLVMINLGVIGAIGLIVRQGFKWTKYLVLLLLIFYFIEASYMIIKLDINMYLVPLAFFMAQVVLVFWSTFVLFAQTQQKLLE